MVGLILNCHYYIDTEVEYLWNLKFIFENIIINLVLF